jgi:hypothetical protein
MNTIISSIVASGYLGNYEVDELKEINPYNLRSLFVASLTIWMNTDEPAAD